MITGANSGIGKATAIGLAKMGATIVMVCRNKERGEQALNDIRRKSNNESIYLMLADLSSLKILKKNINIYMYLLITLVSILANVY